MVTPKVVEEARAHFDCPDLEGAELEDQVITNHELDGLDLASKITKSLVKPIAQKEHE